MKLPTYKNDSFELDNTESIHADHPQKFWIPSKEKRKSLKSGELVKLIFHMLEDDNFTAISVERMWVEITDVRPSFYIGKLDNDPSGSKCLKHGQEVIFQAIHIIDIYRE